MNIKMDDPEWPKLTLEGIAHKAGFNSRTTFFNAIKKLTGLAPTEFLERAKTGILMSFQKLLPDYHIKIRIAPTYTLTVFRNDFEIVNSQQKYKSRYVQELNHGYLQLLKI